MIAGWVGAQGRRLFTCVHRPQGGTVLGGVVLCAPFFFEYYHAHRAQLQLAQLLSAAGFVVVRFDYRGVGDSQGSSREIEDLGTWADDTAGVADLVRSWGVPWVAAVGLRAAANLLADSPEIDVDAMVLWDPVASGRRHVREVTLAHRSATADADEAADGSFAGYPLGAAFVSSLAALAPVQRFRVPTLVLTRNGEPAAGMPTGGDVSFAPAEGQEEMFERSLHLSKVPVPTLRTIVGWLSGRRAAAGRWEVEPAVESTWSEGPVREEVQWIPVPGSGRVFGVACEPIGPSAPREGRPTALFLNSGAQSHIGPRRLHVELARSLAADGVRSVRVDLPGRGESRAEEGAAVGDPPSLAVEPLVISSVIDGLRSARVVAVGLCSGAMDALDAAGRPEVGAVVCINPGLGTVARPGGDGPGYARSVALERAWLRWAKSRRWTGAVVWRIPGPLWLLLDFIGLQGDLSRVFVERTRNGTRLLLVLDRNELLDQRVWSVARRARARWEVVEFDGDHELAALPGRQSAVSACRSFILRWAGEAGAGSPA